MTPDAAKQIWTATVTFGDTDGEKEFKFRADGAWDIQYGNGGDGLDNLVCDGGSGNLVAPAAGTYKVTLDLSKVPYTLLSKLSDFGRITSQLNDKAASTLVWEPPFLYLKYSGLLTPR